MCDKDGKKKIFIMMYNYYYLNEKAKPYGGIKKISGELSDYAEEFIKGNNT